MIAAGNSAAVIVYKAKAARGDENPFEAIMSCTYTLVNGKPRLALYQRTTATHLARLHTLASTDAYREHGSQTPDHWRAFSEESFA